MKNKIVAPDYRWVCLACKSDNNKGILICETCECPAQVSVRERNAYRSNALLSPVKAMLPTYQKHRFEYRMFFGGLFILAVFVLLLLLEDTRIAKIGQLGDFIGGYIGTMFALGSVILLLATLRNQLAASDLQNFENKYYEQIKMHRENVAEFQLGEMTGRKTFVSIVREFQAILMEVRTFSENLPLDKKDTLEISYYVLFYGVGPNSSRMLFSALDRFDAQYLSKLIGNFENPATKQNIKYKADIDYEPVDGHQSRLAHYYRHLYQTVTYVDQQPLAHQRKYDYVKTIRAQLSNYEQAMLLVNSLTPLGKEWWTRDLMKRFRLAHNLPRDFFDPVHELDSAEYFDGPTDFEWQETH